MTGILAECCIDCKLSDSRKKAEEKKWALVVILASKGQHTQRGEQEKEDRLIYERTTYSTKPFYQAQNPYKSCFIPLSSIVCYHRGYVPSLRIKGEYLDIKHTHKTATKHIRMHMRESTQRL